VPPRLPPGDLAVRCVLRDGRQHDDEDHGRTLATVVVVGPAVRAAGRCAGNESHGRLAEEDGRGGGGEGDPMRPDAPFNLKKRYLPHPSLSVSLNHLYMH
jgi:hypothetical protein